MEITSHQSIWPVSSNLEPMPGLLSRFYPQTTSIRLDGVKSCAAEPQKPNEMEVCVAEIVPFTNRLELVALTGRAIEFSVHWRLEPQNNR